MREKHRKAEKQSGSNATGAGGYCMVLYRWLQEAYYGLLLLGFSSWAFAMCFLGSRKRSCSAQGLLALLSSLVA